jgi:hypothetical protein
MDSLEEEINVLDTGFMKDVYSEVSSSYSLSMTPIVPSCAEIDRIDISRMETRACAKKRSRQECKFED